jgi:HK97 family phage portal protein
MDYWRNLLSAFLGKQSQAMRLISQAKVGQAIWSGRDYGKFADQGYRRNAIAYACISMICDSVKSVPWVLYQGHGNQRIELVDHPLLTLLATPNPTQSGSDFLETLAGFYLIAGNVYIEAIFTNKGPQELWLHRPDRMKVVPGANGLPQGYEYQVGTEIYRWAVDPIQGKAPILHLKTFHPLDDWYGMSFIEAAAYGIDLHNTSNAHNKSLLDNGAAPSAVITYKADDGTPLTDTQFYRLKREIEEEYTGARNAGRPLLLENISWQSLGFSPRELDWLQGKNVTAREIGRVFRIPSQMLDIEGSQTYANMEQAKLGFWEDAVIPILVKIRDALNQWLVPFFGLDLYLDFNLDDVSALIPRRAERFDRNVKAIEAGLLTINEARADLGYAPVDGGDVILVQASKLPLSILEEPITAENIDND